MKKMKLIPLATLAVATAFALYGCGGGGQQSQTSADESSAAPAETSAAVAAPAPAETSAAVEAPAPAETSAAPAAAAASAEVSPELVAALDEFTGLVDQYESVVNQAIEAKDYDAYKDQIDDLSNQITALTDKINPLIPEDSSSPDFDYFMDVYTPAAMRFADAGFALIDLIQAK